MTLFLVFLVIIDMNTLKSYDILSIRIVADVVFGILIGCVLVSHRVTAFEHRYTSHPSLKRIY